MGMSPVTNNLQPAPPGSVVIFGQVKRILHPAIKLATEKPAVASGAVLTFATFIASMFSRTLLPVLGIPAISFFIYQIFFASNTDGADQLQDKSEKGQNNLGAPLLEEVAVAYN